MKNSLFLFCGVLLLKSSLSFGLERPQEAFERAGYSGLKRSLSFEGFVRALGCQSFNPIPWSVFWEHFFMNSPQPGFSHEEWQQEGQRMFSHYSKVYTEAFQGMEGLKKHLSQQHETQVVVVFPLSLLNRTDFHISMGWPGGAFVEGRSYHPHQAHNFLEAFAKEKAQPFGRKDHEIVFQNPIPIQDVVAVLAHEELKESLEPIKGHIADWSPEFIFIKKIKMI